MSWHREPDGTIIVHEHEIIKNHLNHGFWLREDGKLVLYDESLLYLCGKEIKPRRFFGRRSSEEVTRTKPFTDAMKRDNPESVR